MTALLIQPPFFGVATWPHFILPSIDLGYYATPAFMRLTRSGMIEVFASDYSRTAQVPTRSAW